MCVCTHVDFGWGSLETVPVIFYPILVLYPFRKVANDRRVSGLSRALYSAPSSQHDRLTVGRRPCGTTAPVSLNISAGTESVIYGRVSSEIFVQKTLFSDTWRCVSTCTPYAVTNDESELPCVRLSEIRPEKCMFLARHSVLSTA